jgi:hypothetical protein
VADPLNPDRDHLVGYGRQRGRAHELDRVVDELDDLLEDELATEELLRTWRDELAVRRDQVRDHVDELELDAELTEVDPTPATDADDGASLGHDPQGRRARDGEDGDAHPEP